MKKFLILTMAVILAVSTVLVTACNKDTTAEISSDSVSESQEQESSSSGQVSRKSKDSANYSDNDSLPPQVSNGSVVSGGSAHASGDSYTVPKTPTEGLPENIATVVTSINNIGTVSSNNYQMKKQLIELAENKYNALSATDKSLVPNADDLKNAKKAYDAFVKSVVVQYIEDFKAKVEAIKGFENTEEFNNKTVVAEKAYDLIDEAYRNEVANEYAILQVALIHAEVNKVPSADSVNGTYYVTVENLKSKLAGLAQNLISIYPKYNEDKEKIQNCSTKISSSMIERSYIAQDENGDGVVSSTETSKTRSDKGDGFFTRTSSEGASQTPAVTYTDKLNTNVSLTRIFKGSISFNAPASGILTFYVRKQATKTYQVFIDGVALDGASLTYDGSDTSDAGAMLRVEIPRAGNVKITVVKNGEEVNTDGGFYAVSYLYSAL